jgi:Domain of unknown function (DUF1929)
MSLTPQQYQIRAKRTVLLVVGSFALLVVAALGPDRSSRVAAQALSSTGAPSNCLPTGDTPVTPHEANHTHLHCDDGTHLVDDAVVRKAGDEAALIARSNTVAVRSNDESSSPSSPGTQSASALTTSDPGVVGQWGAVIDWPVIGIHMSLLPSGSVLAYDSITDYSTELSRVQDHTRAMVFDPAQSVAVRNDLRLGYNVFCSGIAKLADGTVFVAGGNKDQALNGIANTTTFTASTSTWAAGNPMSVARWYPSITPLPNGETLITGGGPSLPEVRTTDGQIRPLDTASNALWANRLYSFFTTAPNGKAQYLGPDNALGQVDVNGSGAFQSQGPRDGKFRDYGSFAHYAPGKVLIAGGGNRDASAVVVDLLGPTVTPTSPMHTQRRQHNLTVLADGSVLATGGFGNSDESLVDLKHAEFSAERWNPLTGGWTTLAPARRVREYHSGALLLPDGRVLTAGGGICGPCDSTGYYNRNAEIFSPPYLFKTDGSAELADRPVISSAPTKLSFGTRFDIETTAPSSVAKVALARLGSVTHSVDTEQRYVPLTFSRTKTGLVVEAPQNGNVAPPGFYMLFVVDTAGVPSVAKIVQIGDTVVAPVTSTPQVVFDDSFGPGFEDWSWTPHNTSFTDPALGARSIAFEPDDWKALKIHTAALAKPATALRFAMNGSLAGGQIIKLTVWKNNVLVADRVVSTLGGPIPAQNWRDYELTIPGGVAAGDAVDLVWTGWTGTNQASVILDDVRLQ